MASFLLKILDRPNPRWLAALVNLVSLNLLLAAGILCERDSWWSVPMALAGSLIGVAAMTIVEWSSRYTEREWIRKHLLELEGE